MNLASMRPHGEVASTGFCLADPGREYLVYLPQGGEVTVDLGPASGQMNVEWLYAAEGTLTHAEPVLGGGQRTLRAPFGGDAILHLWSKCRAVTAKKLAFQSGGELCYFARK